MGYVVNRHADQATNRFAAGENLLFHEPWNEQINNVRRM
jgi:hypothetical protein